jgi:hypothetical protein
MIHDERRKVRRREEWEGEKMIGPIGLIRLIRRIEKKVRR